MANFLLNYFHEPINLVWLLALIPIVIFYLIKSRPKKLNLPTTRFLFKDGNSKNFKSFFSKFQFDPIILLQFLALFFAIFAISIPHFPIERELVAGHTVFVIDNSASMDVDDNFKKVIKTAKNNLGSENSIITISPNPKLHVNNVNADEAEKILDGIKISHGGSFYKDSINFASQIIKNKEKSKIVVLGDLIDSSFEIDYKLLTTNLESKGNFIDYVQIGGRGDNVGFVDVLFGESKTTLYIKNFGKKKNIIVTVGETKYPLKIDSSSVKTLVYDNLKNNHVVEILTEDDFLVDNKLYISGQKVDEMKILYVTNNPSDSLLKALSVNKFITVEVVKLPVFPTIDHDVIIIDKITKDLFYDARVSEIKKAVEGGKSLIIIPNKEMFDIDWQGLWDAKLINISDDNELISPASPINFISSTEFGNIKSPYLIEHSKNSLILAATPSSSIITLDKIKKGNVVYYGMNDENSDFKYTFHYPIFFKNLIDFLSGKESLSNLNFKTGSKLPFKGDVEVRTSLGTTKLSNPQFDKVGFYTVNKKTIGVNLLNERESQIVFDRDEYINNKAGNVNIEHRGTVDTNIYWYLLIILASILLIELFIVKFRGDL